MYIFRTIFVLCLFLSTGSTHAGSDSPLAEAWQHLATFRAGEAMEQFTADPRPEARLGQALSLLALQPSTQNNVDRAESLLRTLADDPQNPTYADALYFLARIPQVHRTIPDPEEALRRYSVLMEAIPGHPLAQLAEVKVAILRLYVLPHPEAVAGKDLFAELNTRGGRLTDPDAIRDFYTVLADAAAHYEIGLERQYSFLRAIDATGRMGGNLRADLLVRLGETARLLEHPSEARTYYERFLAEFPRNNRAHVVTERLQSLSPRD